MPFPSRLAIAVQLGLASITVSGQRLDKPAAWPNLDEFGPVLGRLSRPTSRISPWTDGNISQGCRDRVLYDNLDPTNFKSYDIFLGDCDMPWVLCREEGAQPSIEILVDTFARVPIGMRQFVGDLVHFSGGGGASAWQSSIVHLSGTAAGSVGVFMHEASHCIDGAHGMGMSNWEQTWRDAYDLDTHVADEYAQTDHVENFAQYAGLIIYDRFTNGDLHRYPQYNQIHNQLSRMSTAADSQQDWGEKMFDFSGTKKCGRRWPHTPVVNPSTGNIINKRDLISPRNNNIVIVPLPEKLTEAAVTNCTVGESF